MKRILSGILAVFLVLTLMPTVPMNATAVTALESNFEGYTAISTKEDLNAIRNNLSGHYYLTCDIVFSDEDFSEGGAFYNDGNGWQPIGSADTPFSGILDGNGYTIQNFTFDVAVGTPNSIGLFGNVSGLVQNLDIAGSINVTSTAIDVNIGAIAGTTDGGIVNCTNNCDISVTLKTDQISTENNYAYIGGIVGRSSGSLQNCMNSGCVDVTARSAAYITSVGYIGGVCGYLGGSGEECVNNGAVTVETVSGKDSNISSTYCAGGICGYLKGSIQTCSNTAAVTLCDPRATENNYAFYASGIASFGSSSSQILTCSNAGDVYSAAAGGSYSGGISADANGVIYQCNNSGTILAATQSKNYCVPAVSGGIAGRSGGTISECYNTGSVEWDQLFASNDTYTGGIVAFLTGTVTNCYNAGYVSANMYYGSGGGIAGKSTGTIRFCYDVGTSGVCAAIAGSTNTAPTDCIRSEYSFFGVAGTVDTTTEGTVEQMKDASIYKNFDFTNVWQFDTSSPYQFPTLKNNPHVTDSSENTTDFAGGNGSVEKPYLIKTAQHLKNIGKYPRSNFKLISNIDLGGDLWTPVRNYGVLDGNGFAVDCFAVDTNTDGGCGFIAINEGCIINLGIENVTVYGSGNWIGGIAGWSLGKIKGCYFDGTVNAGGGIVGDADGPVINCCNFGTINGGGGIAENVSGSDTWAGTRHGYIENCVNVGDITGTNAGGIAGYSDSGDIKNCFNVGKVNGTSAAGGIVGSLSQADIINCYNVGEVSSAGPNGAIVGKNTDGYAEDCYYLDNMGNAGPDALINAVALSQEQMTKTKSFKGFDFNTVWTMEGSESYLFPELRSCRFYTVTFLDDDGSVLNQSFYATGASVKAPADPTKSADNTYTYAFAGWDKEIVNCAGDTVYTATYKATYIDYTVTFRNSDGSVLSRKTYHYGDSIAAPASPTKAADDTYTYTFAGWDKEVIACAGDAIYTATYTAVYIDYLVTFQYEDGTVIKQLTLHYGDEVDIPEDPAAPDVLGTNCVFKGWDKDIIRCQGDAVYTAVFALPYPVGDYNQDMQVTNEDVVYLLWHTLFAEDYPIDSKGDFTNDGTVTNEDVVYLLWHTLFPEDYPL